jgi:hypothetical protein
VSKRQRWHEIIANILVVVLVAMAALFFLIATEWYSIFDFVSVPATHVLARHIPELISFLRVECGGFLAGLIGIVCLHGQNYQGRWLIVLAVLYLTPIVVWVRLWFSRVEGLDLFYCVGLPLFGVPPSNNPDCYFDWEFVAVLSSCVIIAPAMIVFGAFLGSKLLRSLPG